MDQNGEPPRKRSEKATVAVKSELSDEMKTKDEVEFKDFAEHTMNELLGWYGYDKVDKADTENLDLKKFTATVDQGASTSRSEGGPQPSSTGAAGGPSQSPGVALGNMAAAGQGGIVVGVKNGALPSRPGDEEDNMKQILCAWCQKVGVKRYTLNTNNESKEFCSEKCFAACRRAYFKRNKVCDWCKHIRHTKEYLDFGDGERRLQFCSVKCLNQYKMDIFCKETQANLPTNMQFSSGAPSPGPMPPVAVDVKPPTSMCPQPPKSSPQANGQVLITPELWLKAADGDQAGPAGLQNRLMNPAVSRSSPALQLQTEPRMPPPPVGSQAHRDTVIQAAHMIRPGMPPGMIPTGIPGGIPPRGAVSPLQIVADQRVRSPAMIHPMLHPRTPTPNQAMPPLGMPGHSPSPSMPRPQIRNDAPIPQGLFPQHFPQQPIPPHLAFANPGLLQNMPHGNFMLPQEVPNLPPMPGRSLLPPPTLMVPYPYFIPVPIPIPIPIPVPVPVPTDSAQSETSNPKNDEATKQADTSCEILPSTSQSSENSTTESVEVDNVTKNTVSNEDSTSSDASSSKDTLSEARTEQLSNSLTANDTEELDKEPTSQPCTGSADTILLNGDKDEETCDRKNDDAPSHDKTKEDDQESVKEKIIPCKSEDKESSPEDKPACDSVNSETDKSSIDLDHDKERTANCQGEAVDLSLTQEIPPAQTSSDETETKREHSSTSKAQEASCTVTEAEAGKDKPSLSPDLEKGQSTKEQNEVQPSLQEEQTSHDSTNGNCNDQPHDSVDSCAASTNSEAEKRDGECGVSKQQESDEIHSYAKPRAAIPVLKEASIVLTDVSKQGSAKAATTGEDGPVRDHAYALRASGKGEGNHGKAKTEASEEEPAAKRRCLRSRARNK
ncbi:uncharacterized protein LOC144925860 isoform X2 [Branchiostoma floridae x Branchiostoma belcheri]